MSEIRDILRRLEIIDCHLNIICEHIAHSLKDKTIIEIEGRIDALAERMQALEEKLDEPKDTMG